MRFVGMGAPSLLEVVRFMTLLSVCIYKGFCSIGDTAMSAADAARDSEMVTRKAQVIERFHRMSPQT
jgi:hypothetical protein